MSLYTMLDAPKHILHIGANWGQETSDYIDSFKDSLESITYIECIPSVYTRLVEHTSKYTHQVQIYTVEALVSDTVGTHVSFHIANNDCGSSSIYPPNPQEWAWKNVTFENEIQLTTTTCDALVENGTLHTKYDTLILDTQGSELNVLKGMSKILPHIQQAIVEFSRRPFYTGGVLLPELSYFLDANSLEPSYIPSGDHGDAIFKRSRE